MGFNRRKLEDQRRQAAEKEAAARRATEAQVLEDAERLIAAWNERQAKRMPMLFSPTNRRRHHRWLLVSVGALSGLPHHKRDQPAHARPSPRRGRDQSHSRAVLPLLPAERDVRRARSPITHQHRRRNADRAHTRRVLGE
jgi:hypothetical protein